MTDTATKTDLASNAVRRRKLQDTAMAMPAFGVILLVSPLLNTVAGIQLVFGLPVSLVYIFSVWLFLILATASLARRLRKAADKP